MKPFPSINQFRHVVAHVRRRAAFAGLDEAGEPTFHAAPKYPTLPFVGTVKLHGTNAAIVFKPDGTIDFQSRERVLTADADNMGFYAHMSQHGAALEALRQRIGSGETVAVFGEWCGQGIQRNVAIAKLPKMFVIFAIKIDDEWLDPRPILSDEAASIRSIDEFPTWRIDIDFERPEVAQNELAALTEAVEACCPVGAAMGVEGTGEGIVWRCASDPTSELWFKVKGEKHSVSKVTTLAAADLETIEKVRDFAAAAVTEARLEQGLQNLIHEQRKPFDMTSIGDFIRWVYGDVVKEESDVIEASGLNPKKIGGPIAQIAKRWYVERMNTFIGVE